MKQKSGPAKEPAAAVVKGRANLGTLLRQIDQLSGATVATNDIRQMDDCFRGRQRAAHRMAGLGANVACGPS